MLPDFIDKRTFVDIPEVGPVQRHIRVAHRPHSESVCHQIASAFLMLAGRLEKMTIIALFYDMFAHNQYIQMVLKGMQCGATAIIVNVVFNLVKKLVKKQLVLPILIFLGTMIAVLAFDVNLMYCVLADALLGLLLLRDAKYN